MSYTIHITFTIPPKTKPLWRNWLHVLEEHGPGAHWQEASEFLNKKAISYLDGVLEDEDIGCEGFTLEFGELDETAMELTFETISDDFAEQIKEFLLLCDVTDVDVEEG